jgi:hypothetical protein
VAKKPIGKDVRAVPRQESQDHFSNLGLVKLPKEVEERVEMLEFVLRNQPRSPYLIACIAAGDTLTLMTTVSVEDRGITKGRRGAGRLGLGHRLSCSRSPIMRAR